MSDTTIKAKSDKSGDPADLHEAVSGVGGRVIPIRDFGQDNFEPDAQGVITLEFSGPLSDEELAHVASLADFYGFELLGVEP